MFPKRGGQNRYRNYLFLEKTDWCNLMEEYIGMLFITGNMRLLCALMASICEIGLRTGQLLQGTSLYAIRRADRKWNCDRASTLSNPNNFVDKIPNLITSTNSVRLHSPSGGAHLDAATCYSGLLQSEMCSINLRTDGDDARTSGMDSRRSSWKWIALRLVG